MTRMLHENDKDATCCYEQILEAAPYKTAALLLLTSHFTNHPSKILFTNPSARAGYDTRTIFKRSLTGLNSEFSFSQTSCLTKAEEPSLSYYLPIAGGRIIGFIPSKINNICWALLGKLRQTHKQSSPMDSNT